MADKCIFCEIVAGRLPCKEAYSDDAVFAFEDINPLAPAHTLVVPRRHVEALAETEPEDEALLGRMVRAAALIAAEKGLTEGGYRMSINQGDNAGQEVAHLHLHVLGGAKLGRMG